MPHCSGEEAVSDRLDKRLLCLSRSLWKHFRAVSLCLFLLVFPAYMAYMICQFFHMDFWLLIIISSSILTSLQVSLRLTLHYLVAHSPPQQRRQTPSQCTGAAGCPFALFTGVFCIYVSTAGYENAR